MACSRSLLWNCPRLAPLLAVFLACTLGGAPLEIARVRVPADRVADWFPRGTEIRSLTRAEFDELVRRANLGLERSKSADPVGPSRAEHSVTWADGSLIGRTILSVPKPREGTGWIPLGEWSPAVSNGSPAASAFRADGNGHAGLWIDPTTPSVMQIPWKLRARTNSRGRSFSLALPNVAISRLDLDLPSALRPELKGVVLTSTAPGSVAGRKTWTFMGPGGVYDLKILEAESQATRSEFRPWVSGTTTVDVDQSGASWTGEWAFEFVEGGNRSVEVEFDESLELLGITGSKVNSFQARRVGKQIRATISFDPSVDTRTDVKIIAAAKTPTSGVWTVPAARPLESVWVGGRTVIRVSEGRTVTECKVRSGSRVPADNAGLARWPTVIAIEPTEPVAVADLTLAPQHRDAIASVTGLLQLDGETPRLLAQVRWSLRGGGLPAFTAELSPGWSVARVEADSDDESIPWRAETLPGGRTRLTMLPPPIDEQAESVAFTIHASAPPADLSIPFDLPRVRPTNSTVEDERWAAITSRSDVLRPTLARSLAWLDPEEVLKSPPRFATARSSQQHATAWRWLGDDSEAHARVVSVPSTEIAQIRELAVVRSDQMELSWKVEASRESIGEELLVHLSATPADEPKWTIENATSVRIGAEPIPPAQRSSLGLPANGTAWRIRAPQGLDRIKLAGRCVLPWKAEGPVPLVTLSSRVRNEGVIELRVSPELLASCEVRDLRALPFENFVATTGDSRTAVNNTRLIRAYAYGDARAQLLLKTRSGVKGTGAGMIREAVLTSIIEPGARVRHRLMLQVAALADGPLELSFPESLRINRIARDGQAVEVSRNDGRVSLPMGPIGGSRSFTIDYTRELGRDDARRLIPDLPACPIPCASFCWEISTPPDWEAVDPTGGLRSTDAPTRPIVASSWSTRPSGDPGAPALLAFEPGADRVLAEIGLSDWLLGLEGDHRPLIVDRLALLEAGWGPRSRIRPGNVSETLRNLGLTLQTYGDSLLLTTARALPSNEDAGAGPTKERLHTAIRRGTDADDRYQAVERWRGESTPRGYQSAAMEAWPWPDRDISGWVTHRFVAGYFPGDDASVRLESLDALRGWAWVCGCLAFAAGVLCLSVKRRGPWVLFACLLAVALVAANVEPNSWSERGRAAVVGLLLALSFGLARRSSPQWHRNRREQASLSRHSLPSAMRIAGIALLLMLTGIVASRTWGQDPARQRILALLPYEGTPKPEDRGDRVLIRLSDDQKLRTWAVPHAPEETAFVTIASASHRVDRAQLESATVESTYELVVEGKGRGTWRFPIGNSIEITTDLDGREVPIALGVDQPEASLDVGAAGRHRVKITRRVALDRGASRSILTLPIVPVASARLDPIEQYAGESVRLLGSTGSLDTVGTEQSSELGPASRLHIAWISEPKAPETGRGQCVALVLWDAVTAGDLARVRLNYRDPGGTSTIRLAIDPGTLVRPDSIPGLIDLSIEGTAEKPEWVARVDPPLTAGTKISLRLWRPIGPTKALSGQGDGELLRSLPRFSPTNVATFNGVVALRHPATWVGRLGVRGDRDTFAEENFVEQWGTLPAEDLTLSGASRLGLNSLVAVRTGLPPARLQARSLLNLRLVEGRVDATLQSKLRSSAEPVREAELTLPPGFVLLRLEADGMTALERSPSNPTRMRLRFDGATAQERSVRVLGRFDVSGTVPLSEVRRYDLDIAPFRWAASVVEPTEMRVDSAARAEVTGSGIQVATDPGMGEGNLPVRSKYTVSPSTDLIRLRWNSAPPRVRVDVDSRLTLTREGVEWLALLRYDIESAPLDGFFVKVPTEWADHLEVEAPGLALQVKKEVRPNGSTILSIKPEGPVWGSATLELRAQRTLDASTALEFPDAGPLGQGAVEKRLTIIRTNARRLPLEASPGLIPLEQPTQDRAGGMSHVTYRVKSEPWSLRVKIEPDEESGDTRNIARVNQSTLLVTRLADGSTWGQGRFDVDPTPGRYLALEFEHPSELPWAVVDGTPVQPLLDASGTWLIPLEKPVLGRVVVAWRGQAHGQKVILPNVLRSTSAALISITGPESGRARAISNGLEPIGESVWWVEWVERRSRRLAFMAANLTQVDPGSQDALVEAVTEWILLERMARRSLGDDKSTSVKAYAARLDEAGVTLFESLELLGLHDLVARALSRSGNSDDRSPTRQANLDATEPVRLRQVGIPWRFRSVEQPEEASAAIQWDDLPRAPWWNQRQIWWSLGIWVGVVLLTTAISRTWFPVRSRVVTVLALIALAIGGFLQPMGATVVFFLVVLGRTSE